MFLIVGQHRQDATNQLVAGSLIGDNRLYKPGSGHLVVPATHRSQGICGHRQLQV